MSEIERAIEKKEYIERGALLKAIGCENAVKYGNKSAEQQHKSYSSMTLYEIADEINDSPAADVEEVVHGEWIREDETQALLSVMWHCSKCEIPLEMNGIYTPIGAGYNYCPNCGAKMDGEKEGV